MFSPHVVHEHMVDHWAHGGAEAGQVVDHTDPYAVHLHPGDTKRQQHQEKEKRDAWGDRKIRSWKEGKDRREMYCLG